MKQLIFLIVIFIFNSFSSYADVKKKALICKCVICDVGGQFWETYIDLDSKPTELGIFLDQNTITYYLITKKEDKIFYKKEEIWDEGEFYTTPLEINWNFNKYGKVKINRKSLQYKKTHKSKSYYFTELRKCEVFKHKSFFDKMKSLANSYQKKYNLKMKDNKI